MSNKVKAILCLLVHVQVLGSNRQIYALKRVRLANKDPEAIRGFIDEITLLKQLRNTPNIIQLISAQVRNNMKDLIIAQRQQAQRSFCINMLSYHPVLVL